MSIHVIAVPYDSGTRDVRMGRGPAHLLDGGLVRHLEDGGHRVEVTTVDVDVEDLAPEPAVLVALNHEIAAVVAATLGEGAFPLILAGSCYTALGTVAGMGGKVPAVVWFDAHGDFNTPETSTSGFLDGMAIAMLTGRCWQNVVSQIPGHRPVPEDRVCLVAARDVDDEEAAVLQDSRVRRCPTDTLPTCLVDGVTALATHASRAYLHFDLDALDPTVGRANALAAPGGLSLAEAVAAVDTIGDRLPLGAASLTAYDPATDTTGGVRAAAIRLALAIAARGEARHSPSP